MLPALQIKKGATAYDALFLWRAFLISPSLHAVFHGISAPHSYFRIVQTLA